MLRERHPSCCACRRHLHGLDGECPTGRDGARGRAALCCAMLCSAVLHGRSTSWTWRMGGLETGGAPPSATTQQLRPARASGVRTP